MGFKKGIYQTKMEHPGSVRGETYLRSYLAWPSTQRGWCSYVTPPPGSCVMGYFFIHLFSSTKRTWTIYFMLQLLISSVNKFSFWHQNPTASRSCRVLVSKWIIWKWHFMSHRRLTGNMHVRSAKLKIIILKLDFEATRIPRPLRLCAGNYNLP